jgi:hypothetical protein
MLRHWDYFPDNPHDNTCLRRTTGKRDSGTLQTYPRCCVLRQISPNEDWDHRHRVLTSITFLSPPFPLPKTSYSLHSIVLTSRIPTNLSRSTFHSVIQSLHCPCQRLGQNIYPPWTSRINMLILPSNNVWTLVTYIIRVNSLQLIQNMLSAFSTDHPMLN